MRREIKNLSTKTFLMAKYSSKANILGEKSFVLILFFHHRVYHYIIWPPLLKDNCIITGKKQLFLINLFINLSENSKIR